MHSSQKNLKINIYHGDAENYNFKKAVHTGLEPLAAAPRTVNNKTDSGILFRLHLCVPMKSGAWFHFFLLIYALLFLRVSVSPW
jgi:hypothetical protein